MAYASLAKIKEHLNVSGTADDAFLTSLQGETDAAIDAYCGRADGFSSASHTEYIDGGGESVVMLSHAPVTAVASVYDDLDGDWESGDLLVATDYRAVESTGELVHKTGTFLDGTGNLKVTYTGGYSSIPSDIELASIRLIGKFYNLRRSGGIRQMSAGAMNLTFEFGMPEDVRTILDKYRRLDV